MLKHDLRILARILDSAFTESGNRLVELSEQSPVGLLFLRHAGCTFCRESLSDIARVRHQVASNGTRIVLVHLGDSAAMEELLKKKGLLELERIVDPGLGPAGLPRDVRRGNRAGQHAMTSVKYQRQIPASNTSVKSG